MSGWPSSAPCSCRACARASAPNQVDTARWVYDAGENLLGLAAAVIRAGMGEGTFRPVDPVAAARAVLFATLRFHHPAHAAEWAADDPAALDAAYDDVWRLADARAGCRPGAPGLT